MSSGPLSLSTPATLMKLATQLEFRAPLLQGLQPPPSATSQALAVNQEPEVMTSLGFCPSRV
jgi:hypothetical protein